MVLHPAKMIAVPAMTPAVINFEAMSVSCVAAVPATLSIIKALYSMCRPMKSGNPGSANCNLPMGKRKDANLLLIPNAPFQIPRAHVNPRAS